MFDLETSIQAWRRDAAGKLAGRRCSIAELEDHLREEFAALKRTGHADEAAWAMAVAKLGDAATLGREFAKLDRLSPFDRLALGVMIGAVGLVVPTLIVVIATRPSDQVERPLLAAHVITITLGYMSGLLAAGAAAYALVRGWLTAKPTPALQTAALQLVRAASVLAVLFTVLGFALGALWADRAWGRAFSADPKEIGAILVALAFIALAIIAWKGEATSHLSQTIAIAGGGVVLAAWFGAIAWTSGFPPALTAIGFGGLTVCLALAAMAFRLRNRAEHA